MNRQQRRHQSAPREKVWSPPLGWSRPAFVFTSPISDFWHDVVPLHWLGLIYQVLTNRPGNIARERLRRLSQSLGLVTSTYRAHPPC